MVADNPRRIAVACAGAAVAVSGAAASITIASNDWQPSALVRVSETDEMAQVARSHDPDFVLFPAEAHFDGAYFYAIALDPLALGDQHELIDRYPYRYGHAGYGWLGAIVSLGDPARVPLALLIVSLASMGVGGWAVSRTAALLGRSPWWGLLVAVNPGLVLSVTVLTSEPAGVAFTSAGLLLWFRRRTAGACVLFAAACLVKEPFSLVPAGLFAWELVQMARHRADRSAPRRMVLLVASVLPLMWWYVYLRYRFDVLPYRLAPDFFGAPFAGWYDSFGFGSYLVRTGASQVGTLVIPILTITASALLVGTVRAIRLRSPFDAIFLLVVAVASLFNYLLLGYPKDLVRELVIPLLLLPAVIGSAWPPAEAAASVSTEAEDREEEASEDDLSAEGDRGHRGDRDA